MFFGAKSQTHQLTEVVKSDVRLVAFIEASRTLSTNFELKFRPVFVLPRYLLHALLTNRCKWLMFSLVRTLKDVQCDLAFPSFSLVRTHLWRQRKKEKRKI